MNLTFRPMRDTDRPSVTELCAHIWDGHDYIPQIFDDWLAQPKGQFTAGFDDQAQLICLGKLTYLADMDWWIEGLRVHPNVRGQRVGRQLHQYHLDLWRQLSPPYATLRLVTDHDNAIIQHLNVDAGFKFLGGVVPYKAASVKGSHNFRRLASAEAQTVFPLAQASHYYQTHHQLYQAQTLWRWATLTPQALAQREVWLWHEGRGLVIVEDANAFISPLNVASLHVDFLGVAKDDLAECLRELCALAHELNYAVLAVGVMLSDTILLTALAHAGYVNEWQEGNLRLYEMRK